MVGMPSGRSPPFALGIIAAPDQVDIVFRPVPRASPPTMFQAMLLDATKRHPSHTRRTRINAGEPIGVDQDVLATDLVVEQIEAESGLRLRLAVELSLKVRILSGVVRLITNHLHLTIFKSAPEVGALCSTGITRHQRSYCPVRLPP